MNFKINEDRSGSKKSASFFPLVDWRKYTVTLTVQMKNWLPLVFGPALAMLSTPGPV